jgi:hypothetical protein
MTHVDDGAKNVLDLLSVTTVVGTLMGILPSIAAIFTIIWTSIRIYESNTVQNLIQKMKGKNNASS